MAKINFSVPDDFLKMLDGLVKSTGLSRSEIIRRGVKLLIKEQEEREEDRLQQERREAASKRIDDFREKHAHLVPSDWDSVKVIRELRDRDPSLKWKKPETRPRQK